MLEIISKILLSYLLGSLMGGIILARLTGKHDLRQSGSKSAGATNALRLHGKGFAAAVFLVDIAKGWLAVAVVANLPWFGTGQAVLSSEALQACCGAAAVLGHLFPLFFGFRGGKGVATLVGVMLGLSLPILGVALAVWLVILLLSGYVGLASMGAALAAALTAGLWLPGDFLSPLGLFCIAMALLTLYTHRANIQRLRDGSEHRFNVLGRFR
jgi:glycerol-3-phosphate acyltransferase PlsY